MIQLICINMTILIICAMSSSRLSPKAVKLLLFLPSLHARRLAVVSLTCLGALWAAFLGTVFISKSD